MECHSTCHPVGTRFPRLPRDIDVPLGSRTAAGGKKRKKKAKQMTPTSMTTRSTHLLKPSSPFSPKLPGHLRKLRPHGRHLPAQPLHLPRGPRRLLPRLPRLSDQPEHLLGLLCNLGRGLNPGGLRRRRQLAGAPESLALGCSKARLRFLPAGLGRAGFLAGGGEIGLEPPPRGLSVGGGFFGGCVQGGVRLLWQGGGGGQVDAQRVGGGSIGPSVLRKGGLGGGRGPWCVKGGSWGRKGSHRTGKKIQDSMTWKFEE